MAIISIIITIVNVIIMSSSTTTTITIVITISMLLNNNTHCLQVLSWVASLGSLVCCVGSVAWLVAGDRRGGKGIAHLQLLENANDLSLRRKLFTRPPEAKVARVTHCLHPLPYRLYREYVRGSLLLCARQILLSL